MVIAQNLTSSPSRTIKIVLISNPRVTKNQFVFLIALLDSGLSLNCINQLLQLIWIKKE